MPLVWMTIAPAIKPGQAGHMERKRQHDSAVNFRNGQVLKIADRYYPAAVTGSRVPTIRLLPHDLDEAGGRT
jgi:hypothetical protein